MNSKALRTFVASFMVASALLTAVATTTPSHTLRHPATPEQCNHIAQTWAFIYERFSETEPPPSLDDIFDASTATRLLESQDCGLT
jgi:hypothetical protein